MDDKEYENKNITQTDRFNQIRNDLNNNNNT